MAIANVIYVVNKDNLGVIINLRETIQSFLKVLFVCVNKIMLNGSDKQETSVWRFSKLCVPESRRLTL